MAISDAVRSEIRRKAGLGLDLTHETEEKKAIYDSYAADNDTRESVVNETIAEIKRKANLGIDLSDPNEWEGKQDVYNSYSSSGSSSTKRTTTTTTPSNVISDIKNGNVNFDLKTLGFGVLALLLFKKVFD